MTCWVFVVVDELDSRALILVDLDEFDMMALNFNLIFYYLES